MKTFLSGIFLLFWVVRTLASPLNTANNNTNCLPLSTIDPPQLISAFLNYNGDVTLTWTPPADPGGHFNSYQVFSSINPNGPFIQIDSIFNYSQITHTYLATGPKYFFMTCRTDSNVYSSATSDTLQGINVSDVGVIDFINLNDTTVGIGQLVHVTVILKNFGQVTETSIPLNYTGNGAQIGAHLFTGTLPPGATDTITFQTTFICPVLSFLLLCSRTFLSNDIDPSNNAYCKTFYFIGIEQYVKNQFHLFQNTPNPAHGTTQIKFNVPENDKIEFSVTTILGQPVFKEEREAVSGINQLEYDLSDIPDGLYFYSILFQGQKRTKRIIIE